VTDGRYAEPFEQTTHPDAYVPRPETEQALDRLLTWARSGHSASIRVTGAAGTGKTLLLRVLAERTAGQPAAIHVPYANLTPDDLAGWVLEAIGEHRESNARSQLVAAAKQRAERGGLLLLIDDADLLPPQTRDALDIWYRLSEGSLRNVRAGMDVSGVIDEAAGDEEVALTPLLDGEQSTALLSAAMDRANLHGPLRARFNRAAILQLHDRARGIPARLLDEAASLFHEWSSEAAPPMPGGATEEPPRAPTQRALAQLELTLAAELTTPPPLPRPTQDSSAGQSELSAWELSGAQSERAIPDKDAEQSDPGKWGSSSSQSERMIPDKDAEQSGPGTWGSPSSRSERVIPDASAEQGEPREGASSSPGSEHPEPRPPPGHSRSFDLPPPPPPPKRTTSTPAWAPARWLAVAGAAALVVALASNLLRLGGGDDAIVEDVAVSEAPPIASEPAAVSSPAAATAAVAAPPPAQQPVASETPVAEPEVGSIEFLGAVPAAPEPTPAMAARAQEPADRPVDAPDRAPTDTAALESDRNVVDGVIGSGEWLAASFRRRGVPAELASVIAREMAGAYDFRHSQPGDRYRVTRDRSGELVSFHYEPVGQAALELRFENGRYELR